jgi:protein-S-isoprenylcysteine O-methyltransferase Ste14
MKIHWESWLAAAFLIACLASFAWAMRKFFVWPARVTAGIKLITACGVVFGALHLLAILAARDLTVIRCVIGVALYLSALGLFWWAINTSIGRPLSAAFSPDLPAHLVVHGPYRVIRHPFYCSYLICWLAGWVVTGRIWLGPTVATMVIVYLVAAALEEKKFMRSPLADVYREYRSRTGLLVPNPLKLFSSGGKRSWESDFTSESTN